MPQVEGHPRISVDADTVCGKPRITGSRIAVELILQQLAAGATIEWIVRGYPGLSREDVSAALAFAEERVNAASAPPPKAAE